MPDNSEALDDNVEPSYFEVVITHQLHRIWELQAAMLMLMADTDEERAFVQDIIDKQRVGEYTTPFEW